MGLCGPWGDQPDLSGPPFMRESGVVASPHVVAEVQRNPAHWCLARSLQVRGTTFGAYGKEPFSVYLRFEGVSGRFSDAGDQGLRGYTEKI